jgi:bacterioferritin-associated ferredoxin
MLSFVGPKRSSSASGPPDHDDESSRLSVESDFERCSFPGGVIVIVCLCHGVDEAEIEELIADGADSLPSVGKACGAGTDCGSCRGHIQDMIEEAAESPDRVRCRLRVA